MMSWRRVVKDGSNRMSHVGGGRAWEQRWETIFPPFGADSRDNELFEVFVIAESHMWSCLGAVKVALEVADR